MRWVSILRLRARSLLRSSRVEEELQEELRDHVERLAETLTARGFTPDGARLEALRRFGGMVQQAERCRDARGIGAIDDLARDLRYAFRSLRRSPGFALVSVLSLALGLGANAAIFSVVNAVLLRPLAYSDPDRLVFISHGGVDTVAPGNLLDWRAQNHVFERVGAAEDWTPNVTGGDKAERIHALRLTGDVLPMLGVRPLLGRLFTADETHAGRDGVMVISYALWKNRFGGETGAIGRSVTLDGEPRTIVGVMPEGFRFAPFWETRAQLWAPLVLDRRASNRTAASLRAFARLKPGVTLAQARGELAAIAARLEQQFPGTNRDVTVSSLQDRVVGSVRPALLVLLGAVQLVLLIACTNVAHLQLVRAATREKEIALRRALGASRARVARQLLVESGVLAVAGACTGTVLAYSGIRALAYLAPPDLPRVETISMDGRVFLFLATIGVLSSFVFGLVPAFRASRGDLTSSLKDGTRSAETAPRSRARRLLVASQFAMALVLLAGAGLIARTFAAMRTVDAGFDPRGILSVEVSVTGSRSAEPHRRVRFFPDLVERVAAIPGVESVGAINHLPLGGDTWRFPFSVQGRPPAAPGDRPFSTFRVVTPEYFRTMRIPIVRGRGFTERDDAEAAHVAVINEHMARRHWPGEDPIGQRITWDDPTSGDADWRTIVGIAKTVRQSAWTEQNSEEMYFPFLQTGIYRESAASFASYLTLVARTSASPASLAPLVEALVRSMDRDVTLAHETTMEEVIGGEFVEPRFYLVLLGVFAAVAVTLAAVGIYGVMSYAVTRRAHEIGVRLALGARRSEVVGAVVGEGMRLAALGGAVGLATALVVMPYLRTLLFGVQPIDPATLVAVTLFLALVGITASYIPARRASRVDPMAALRCE